MRISEADHDRVVSTMEDLPKAGFKCLTLDLRNAKATDSCLDQWSDWPRIEGTDGFHWSIGDVRFDGKKVTGRGFDGLAGCRKLFAMHLADTRVDDEGLQQIKRLDTLRELYLHRTQVTDRGLVDLQRALPDLEQLALSGTGITDDGLPHVAALPRLRNLFLDGTAITDQGMQHLKAMQHLGILDSTGTKVGDAGLGCLRHMVTLRVLRLAQTQVTAAGVAKLHALLPPCQIAVDAAVQAELEKIKAQASPPSADPDRRAAEDLLKHGARLRLLSQVGEIFVQKPEELPGGPFKVMDAILPDSPTAELVRSWLPLEQLRSLEFHQFHGNEELGKALAELRSLRGLDLFESGCTDADVQCFAGLVQLESLSLQRTRITNGSLPIVAKLSHLQFLNLSDTQVTDARTGPLGDLKSLRTLPHHGHRHRRDGTGGLCRVDVAAKLWLSVCGRLSEEGMRRVAEIPGIDYLNLDFTPVTSAGSCGT